MNFLIDGKKPLYGRVRGGGITHSLSLKRVVYRVKTVKYKGSQLDYDSLEKGWTERLIAVI